MITTEAYNKETFQQKNAISFYLEFGYKLTVINSLKCFWDYEAKCKN